MGRHDRAQDKFTLEHLRSLNDVLGKHAVVTEGNKDVLVETFRSMAELLTWGDQHEPAIFDFFVEKRMLAHFVRILVQCAPAHAASSPHLEPFTVVAVQLLQTLSILVQNTRRETSIYYLFSNNYINDLMELKQFDYGVDEEVLAWYISFLKAISLRLNDRTIQFFVSDAACAAGAAGGRRNSAATAEGEGVPTAFPLYSQVIRYVQHSESMVRAAARAATLNVFRVNDTAARNFVLSGPEHGYFASLAASLVEQTIALSEPFASALPGRWSAIATAVAKLGDLLCYCNDVLDLEIEGISNALTGALWQGLIEPLLAAVRANKEESSEPPAGTSGVIVEPTAAFYVLSRLCHSLTYRPLLTAITDALLADGGGGNRHRHGILQALASPACNNDAVGALCLLGVLASSQYTDDAVLEAVGLLPARRRTKLRLLAALTDATAVLQLPRQASDASSSAESGTDEGSEEEAEADDASTPAAPSTEAEAAPPDDVPVASDAGPSAGLAEPGSAASDAACTAQQQIIDALVAFMVVGAQVDGSAHLQALSYAAWLLRELGQPGAAASGGAPAPAAAAAAAPQATPPSRFVSALQAEQLQAAAAAAAASLAEHVQGPWADAVAPLVCTQWRLASRVGEPPALGDEHVAALVFHSATGSRRPSAADGCPAAAADAAPPSAAASRAASLATAPAAERALLSVRRWLVLHGACMLLLGRSPEAAPRLAALPDGYACAPDELREGATAPAAVAEGVPCRVAFERGKERRVLLTATACSIAPAALPIPGGASCVTSMLLLTEAAARSAAAGGAAALLDGAAATRVCAGGAVHAVAPAAGAEPYADASHRKWLHLRVRPSVATLLACAALPLPPGGPPWAPGWAPPPPLSAARRLQDGHWTLAFASEELCQEALQCVSEHTERLRAACADVLAPLLD